MADTPKTPTRTRRKAPTAAPSPEQGKQQQAAPVTEKPKRATRKPAAAPEQGKQQQAAAPAEKPKRSPRKPAVAPEQGKQQQAAPAVEKTKVTRKKAPAKMDTAPAGSGRGRGGQQQSAGDDQKPFSQVLRETAGRKGERAIDKQEQTAGKGQGAQGATSAGKGNTDNGTQSAEMRGGTKQVLIEHVKMVPRAGREPSPEEYPFGDLPPSQKVNGEIEGPSFFISDAEKAKDKLAAARKRHKPTTFWTRRTMEKVNGKGPMVPGIRIWKAPS